VNAKTAGYDGVEVQPTLPPLLTISLCFLLCFCLDCFLFPPRSQVMGSEGYLINQFIVKNTNKRTDEWGGSYANRTRLPVEIVKAVRKAVGPDFIIIYRSVCLLVH
jgi:2,4-dienoyl-CoA reductase-like NADH-dependent reductase (Old Yellow Enzyme family)